MGGRTWAIEKNRPLLYLLGDLWEPFFRKVLKDRSNVIIKVHYLSRSALEIVL